jgi:hypothetical protein
VATCLRLGPRPIRNFMAKVKRRLVSDGKRCRPQRLP